MTLAELDSMSFKDISYRTNICMDERTIMCIWKKDDKFRKEGTAYWRLTNDPNFAREIVNNDTMLYLFLLSNEKEIDKLMFLAYTYRTYMHNLATRRNMADEEKQTTNNGIEGIRELCKGLDETVVIKNTKSDAGNADSLFIFHTKEVAEGRLKRNNTNQKRLNELKEKINFRDVVQSIFLSDLSKITFEGVVGSNMQTMILTNTLVKKYGKDQAQKLMNENSVDELMRKLDRSDYCEEIINVLEVYIEEVNLDKLLLYSAYRYIEELEKDGLEGKDVEEELKVKLEIILGNIKKNAQIRISDKDTYTKRELEKDLGRLIISEGNITYVSKERIKELRNKILNNEITLNDILLQEFELIKFTTDELKQIVQKNPENYIFLLNNDKNKDNKETILANIINARRCSTTLLRVLCEKLDINIEDALNLFENGLLEKNEALEIVKEKVGTIITDEILIEKYKTTVNQDYCQRKESEQEETEKQKEARRKLERYAAAYVYAEILGKEPDEILDKNYKLSEKIMGENVNPLDVILLYEFNLIDIECAIELGDKEVKDELIARKTLRLKDAKYLRKEWSKTETGKLSDDDIIKILREQTYEQQILFMAFVLGDDYNTINKVNQYLKIGYGISNGKNTRITDKTKNKTEEIKSEGENNSVNENAIPTRMREPIAKVSLLLAFDADAVPLEGIIDGHVIIIYPNLEKVCIEKLHKTGRDGQKRNENKAATYFMTKKEFEKYKEDIIKDGRVNRSFLIEKWMRDPEHWLAHNGNEHWEKELLKMFGVEKEDSRYSEEEKERIKKLAQMSIKSKREPR